MRHGVISAGDQTTLRTACVILEEGGNAFDAAVAAVFTSMTSEFILTGAGGGGALLAYPQESEPILFDFFVDSPLPQPDKDLDFFDVSVDFVTTQQVFHIGKGSVAVPGTLAGLLHVHKRLGCLPLEVILEPAISTAKEGVILNTAQAFIFKLLEPILTHGQKSCELFCPNGILLKENDLFQNPAFADFLEQIIRGGSNFFYRGDGAKLILKLAGDSGLITTESLKNYRVMERKPVTSHFLDKTIFTNPAPSTGGVLITFILQLLEQALSSNTLDNPMLVQAMDVTSRARRKVHIDPDDEFQIERLLTPAVFAHYKNVLRSGSGTGISSANTPGRGATTHVSVIDNRGNAASVTTTNGEGCGYLIPEMGIMLNNMLGEEDINPMGFHKWTRQRRLPSMISPTVIAGNQGPELVLGSGGSNRIRSAITQVILNVIIHKMDLKAAVEAPRLHLEGNVLHCEPGIAIGNVNDLPAGITVHNWDALNMFFGGVNAVTPAEAAGDSRRGGVGVLC